MKLRSLISILCITLLGLGAPLASAQEPSRRVHTFYYPWYGNPTTDVRWIHWEQSGHVPPSDISANYYPQLGTYSGADRTAVAQHMAWLRQAGVGVLIYSWWGRGSLEDRRALLTLDEAAKRGIQVAWHIEPYPGRTIDSVSADIRYLYDAYGTHAAFFKASRPTKYGNTTAPRGVFYIFQSSGGAGAIPAASWRPVLDVLHADARYNAIVLGQTANPCYIDGCNDLNKESHFDGIFTYDGFGYDGSTFAGVNQKVKERNSIFSPSVAPGYVATRATPDTRIKPRFNSSPACTGYTYDCMWNAAIASGAEWVSITSFNEWHEGTQIEPAVSKAIAGYTYSDYNDFEPAAAADLYLTKTATHVQAFDPSGTTPPGTPVPPPPVPPTTPPSATDPILAGAGDIACGPAAGGAPCKQMETSNLLLQIKPNVVVALGDNQYEQGAYQDFVSYYGASWGRVKAITRPAVGNHEYLTAGATGYYDYFNGVGSATGPAGDRNKGYYSYDLGAWHVVVLNSNCSKIGGCQAGSAQEQWLRGDLAAHPTACTVAYQHHPPFSSGQHGNDPQYQALWQALYDNHVELLLVGHDHIYERFAPQTATGAADAKGVREFIVGLGGRNKTSLGAAGRRANSEVFYNSDFGVIKFNLHPASYDWQFINLSGQIVDAGTSGCNGSGGTIPTPPPPASGTVLTIKPSQDAYVDAALPGSNFGSATTLRVDGSPQLQFALSFPVSGIAGRQVIGATLRLYTTNPSKNGGEIHRIVNPAAWNEAAITWNTRPAFDAAVAATVGSVVSGSWKEVDVTSLVKADGAISLLLTSSSTDGAYYASKEAGASTAPELRVTVSGN